MVILFDALTVFKTKSLSQKDKNEQRDCYYRLTTEIALQKI